jgi:NAD(P)-dependent dehydrogenase (short-subunit alcohol dehydrogenase family)
LDVQSEPSVEAVIATILRESGRLDTIIHNAGHMVFGPAEAFTPEQYAAAYDVNVLGTQRVSRVALPTLRRQGRGLVVWVSSSSARGGTPPWLAPYFAAKAGMDSFGGQLCWRIGAVGNRDLDHRARRLHEGHQPLCSPSDTARAAEYADGPTGDIPDIALKGLSALEPPGADASEVAEAIARVVDMQRGARPFRVHIDPSQDGAEVVNGVADRVRAELLRRIGLADLLHPSA